MSYYNLIEKWKNFDFDNYFTNVRKEDILSSMEKEVLDEFDFLNLLSPLAKNHIESMAKKANSIKKQYFGNVISLYMPIYISNYCTSTCTYCGFSKGNNIHRKHLTLKEIEEEAIEIAKTGVTHILMLTGEAEGLVSISYLKSAIEILKKYFSSVSIEIFPMEEEEYKELVDIGLDGLTIYQETYDEEVYDKVHLSGRKKDYHFRLNTAERGAKAGIRAINIGALFGLSNHLKEGFFTGLHLKYLTDKYLGSNFGVSFPRINPAEGGFSPDFPLDDITFVQFILAFRIFQIKADISISTREVANFRDNLMHLGITRMSVGSKTDVGGYYNDSPSSEQFQISDIRTAKETIDAIIQNGYQPIYKDWEQLL